jgi:hypothetical protein
LAFATTTAEEEEEEARGRRWVRSEAVVVVSVVVSTATSVVATTRMAAVGMMFILFTLLRILAMISVAMSREHPMPLFGEGAVDISDRACTTVSHFGAIFFP